MWRNYLTVGVRALAKNRIYAAINIVGLAIGMAACLMILLYVRYETSWDRVAGAERSYELMSFITDPGIGRETGIQGAPYAAGPALKRAFPEVEAVSYLTNAVNTIMDRGEPTLRTITLVEPSFPGIFPVRTVRGDLAAALRDPNGLAVDEKTAGQLFRGADPIGHTVTTIRKGQERDRRVLAVFADLPRNSHQSFSMLGRFDEAELDPQQVTAWGWISGNVYLRLRPGTDATALGRRFTAWALANAPKEDVGGRLISQAIDHRFVPTALADIHLGDAQQGAERPGNDRGAIATFAIVAILILAMACVNFVNLATARASKRAREISLRKVLGAQRQQLVIQFLVEAMVVAAVALLLALAMVEVALPWVARFLDAAITLRYFGRDGLLLPMIGLMLVVGLAAGAYPALVMSRFRPAEVLKANRSSADTRGSAALRTALVVGQFAVSIGLIICTLVVYGQTVHARSVDVGFRREGLLQLDGLDRAEVAPVAETLKREILHLQGVVAAARTSIGLETANRSTFNVVKAGVSRPYTIGGYSVEPGFVEAMGIPVLAGRTLSASREMDDATTRPAGAEGERALAARGINVVVNALAARQLGYATPADAIGQTVRTSFIDGVNGLVPSTIVGVVGDTRYRSLREPPEAIIYRRSDDWLPYLEVRVASDASPAAVRGRIEQLWKRMLPRTPFQAEFVDDKARGLYKAEAARAEAFAAFALLSVVIGCLGLFGLASFTAERRTREIGIRKVLGARTRDIVRLLVWQFSRPVLIANLIAWPIAWWLMRGWLNGFDDRIGLGPAPFLGAGVAALLIAVATIGGHAVRVARASPIRALRYE